VNHPTSLSSALRTLDRTADATAHRDRARLNSLLLEVFTGLLPPSALTERENHLMDVIWQWRLDLAERAGQSLPRVNDHSVTRRFEEAVTKAVEGNP
jgi:hypothetical protein